MGVQTAPWAIAQTITDTDFEHPVELARNLNEAIGGERSGVFRVGDFAITTPGVGLTVDVAAGNALLVGVESATQGAYFAWSDATEAVSFGAPAASIRYDTILLRVADKQYGTITGNCRAYLEVVAGVAGAGAPRADSYFNTGGGGYQPGAWLRLADVQVDPGATSIAANKISHNLRYTRVAGFTPCLSTTNPSDPVAGDRCFETDTKLLKVYDGSAWRWAAPWSSTTTLSGTAASITISGIPSTAKKVQINWTSRSNRAVTAEYVRMRVNGNTGNNYNWAATQSVGATTTTAPVSAFTTSAMVIGVSAGASATASIFGSGQVNFSGWNSPHTSYLGQTNEAQVMQSAAAYFIWNGGGHFSQAGPYTSLTFLPELDANLFEIGTQFTVHAWD